jgi:hypothetical protein
MSLDGKYSISGHASKVRRYDSVTVVLSQTTRTGGIYKKIFSVQ